jgi:hypothetical protein
MLRLKGKMHPYLFTVQDDTCFFGVIRHLFPEEIRKWHDVFRGIFHLLRVRGNWGQVAGKPACER